MTASSEVRGRGTVSVRRIALPDVVGLDIKDARIVLATAGFERVQAHYSQGYEAEFSVLDQFPRAGMLVYAETDIVLTVNRQNLVGFLPQVFRQSTEEGAPFLKGFLYIVQTLYDSVNQRVARLHELFDPRTADADFMPWLASWLALTLNPDWTVLQRRKMIMAAAKLFPVRGTAMAIREFVQIYVGVDVTIEENSWPFNGFRIGVNSTVGDDTVILPTMNLAHCFVVSLKKAASAVPDDEIVKIHQIIQSQKPAHTSYFLSFSDEAAAGEMGAFMSIGAPIAEGAPAMGIGIGIGADGAAFEVEGAGSSTGLTVSTEDDAAADAHAGQAKKPKLASKPKRKAKAKKSSTAKRTKKASKKKSKE